ncbi:hypothetical protein [Algoriphagus winogradskyi]|jgi:hypothetical protein|uniref:HPt domain-containing protein n=1 Tax=Algoriphagus winogradskyi TaxID=237017 RepID=A0ABY1P5C6_9BACT|nr:hypothetical protein [Algoriphagus winogradskyi]SMP26117.1 hypothetical protein SAMN06265367_104322 [Algoriphagus winogradskyi]
MEQIYPELEQLISEMTDGDSEFKKELTFAIHKGLLELKEVYAEGSIEKNEVKLQQIRHKLKPTLAMFELFHITEELQNGKEIIENQGFECPEFAIHYENLQSKLEIAIKRVFELT